MVKHMNALSFAGSVATVASYASWVQTLSLAALIVTILTGLLTFGYTVYKWANDVKQSKKKDNAK